MKNSANIYGQQFQNILWKKLFELVSNSCKIQTVLLVYVTETNAGECLIGISNLAGRTEGCAVEYLEYGPLS